VTATKRHFGNIRKRESGRYQARYRGPDGRMRSAQHTFARRADAAAWLALKEAEIRRDEWIAPEAARQTFREYAEDWVSERVLKARTQELYRGLLRNHLNPTFGHLGLGAIDEQAVRRWRKERLEAGPLAPRPFGAVVVAKAYRLLHSILATASDDRMIKRNPCRIEKAGQEKSPEREIPSLLEVIAVAKALPRRYRMLVLLATFTSLRWGELVALRRESVDLAAGLVKVTETIAELDAGGLRPDTPKSEAGRRTVAIPPELLSELRWHLDNYAGPGERGLIFVGPKGATLRRSNFRQLWNRACDAAGVPGLHFHDLRHLGGTLTAATGATLRELMARLGHSSPRAAMIYQHATGDRDLMIARALGSVASTASPADFGTGAAPASE
jgi:integrase